MSRAGELTSRVAHRARALARRYQRAGWSVIDQSIVSVCNFVSILLLARFLPPAEFGAFALAQTGLLLVTSMQTSLLTQPHNVLGARLRGEEYRRFTGALVLAQLLAGALLCAVLVLAGLALRRYGNAAIGAVVLALAGVALPWMGQEFVRRVFYTTSDSRAAASNDLLCYGSQLVGVVMLVHGPDVGQLSAISALTVFGVSSLFAAGYGVWQLRHQIDFGWGASFGVRLREAWAQVWNFGRWLLAHNFTVWLGANGHVWIVGGLLGAEAVGWYRAAIHLVNAINPLRQAAFVYLPARASIAFQNGGHAEMLPWVRGMSSRLALPLLPFVLALVAFPEQLLTLVYGERFTGMGLGTILALATLAQTVSFLRYPMEVAILATGASRSLFHIHLLPVALLPTLGVALIASFGLIGVPWSMLSISIVLFVVTWLVYRQLMTSPVLPAVQRG